MSQSNHPRIFLMANTAWYLYNFRLPLLQALLSQGYSVYTLAPHDAYVEKLEAIGINHIFIKMARSSLNPYSDIKLLMQLLSIYRRYKPYLVQHFTIKPVIYGSIAAQFSGVKKIFNMIPGMGYVFTGRSVMKFWVQQIVRYLYKPAMNFSHHVFFQNEDDRNYFLKYGLIPEYKTSIIPGSGVDVEKFKPGKRTKCKNITYIVAARMLWDKGIGEFVEAARLIKKKYQNTNFWLLGPVDRDNPKGIELDQLQQWTNEGVVQYLGMTDNIKHYLAKADVIVLPSYYKEGLPLSLLEGAAMAMPIITTDSTGCREVVEKSVNGFLIPTQDSIALAASMERFVENPELINRMGNASRKIALKRFDSRTIVKKILQHYQI